MYMSSQSIVIALANSPGLSLLSACPVIEHEMRPSIEKIAVDQQLLWN